MGLLHIIILGLTQGLTEFLPISSSGHLVVARLLFNIPDVDGTFLDAFLHLGTLLAVLTYYYRVWIGMFRGMFVRDQEGNDKRDLLLKIVLATIPAAVVGYLMQDVVSDAFRSAQAVAIGLLFTAVALLVGDYFHTRAHKTHRASLKEAFLIGVSQVLALVPGVSRSGATVAAGRAAGLTRTQAINFSFLLSVPIIAGAGLGTAPALLQGGQYPSAILLAGFLTSFLSGLAAISFFVRISQRMSFTPFAVYLVVLSCLLFVLY